MKCGIALLFLFFSTSIAFAGDGSTSVKDGGHGVLCRNQELTLLDFYESKNIVQSRNKFDYRTDAYYDFNNNDQIKLDSESEFELCLKLNDRLNSSGFAKTNLAAAFGDACRLADKIDVGEVVQNTYDYGELMTKLPGDCKIVQVANHTWEDGKEKVTIYLDLLELLSLDQLSGLLLHESLHKYFPAKTSTEIIRQFVIYAYANRDFQLRNYGRISAAIASGKPIPARDFR
jgi:hypothetical protein